MVESELGSWVCDRGHTAVMDKAVYLDHLNGGVNSASVVGALIDTSGNAVCTKCLAIEAKEAKVSKDLCSCGAEKEKAATRCLKCSNEYKRAEGLIQRKLLSAAVHSIDAMDMHYYSAGSQGTGKGGR